MPTQNINGDSVVTGTQTASLFLGPAYRSNLTTEPAQAVPIPLTAWRIWDSSTFATLGAASGTALGFAIGAFATGLPYIATGNARNTTIQQRARALVQLPYTYVGAAAASLRFAAGILPSGAIATTSMTLTCEVYLSSRDALKSGSQLVSTSATTMNSLTFGNIDFALTATTLIPGSWLDVRITVDATSNNVADCYGAIPHAELVLSVKG